MTNECSSDCHEVAKGRFMKVLQTVLLILGESIVAFDEVLKCRPDPLRDLIGESTPQALGGLNIVACGTELCYCCLECLVNLIKVCNWKENPPLALRQGTISVDKGLSLNR